MSSAYAASHLPRFEPEADPAAVVRAPHARLTVLTSRLFRLEFSPDDRFEDRASQAFWYRRRPVPPFDLVRTPDGVEIVTEHLHLRYRAGRRRLGRDSLSIAVRQTGTTWHYGDRDPLNLRGTARTVDGADGPVPLEPGLMSRAGWAVVDDSASLVFGESGWLAPRAAPDNLDLYFFGYGHDYAGCLQDYMQVSGSVPLVPRWALGNWWSRYWEYNQAELAQLMADFQAHDVPLSVCVVDMDWHITDTGNTSSGWTGYTWNRELFPDPEGFIRELHERGLKVSLNLHPAAGIHPHEDQYPAMARRLGIDPAGGEPVPFDIADPEFAAAYFEILHHPLEAQGIDFWWIDWQQGQRSGLAGLDPLWWLNHLHFYDLARDGLRRPFIFSRWGGLGSHRYPIGFSGDSIVSWKSLAFQPYFTATAANVGFGWWSHDIGGHMRGVEDPELYTRWVQFGALSPILRLHSTKNPYHERRPWGYDAEVLRITRAAMQLRHALIPYLYTQAWRFTDRGVPPIVPMYMLHPEEEDAYHCPQQYAFGSELIAAPYVTPREPDTGLSRQAVWLPEGDWFDLFSGHHYPGGRWHTLFGALDDSPILARAGAIVPLSSHPDRGSTGNPAELALHLFPGAANRFELYEDDGHSPAYRSAAYGLTPFTSTWETDTYRLHIGPTRGDLASIPPERSYVLLLHGVRRPDHVHLAVDGTPRPAAWSYDETSETLALPAVDLSPSSELTFTAAVDRGRLLAPRDRRLEVCRRRLRAFHLASEAKKLIDADLPAILADARLLQRHSRHLTSAQLAALCDATGG